MVEIDNICVCAVSRSS